MREATTSDQYHEGTVGFGLVFSRFDRGPVQDFSSPPYLPPVSRINLSITLNLTRCDLSVNQKTSAQQIVRLILRRWTTRPSRFD